MPREAWNTKDWKKVLDAISSPEESDAEDELNVVQVQRNARRVAELMHNFVPGITGRDDLKGDVPMGMNNADLIREGLAASMRAQSLYSAANHSQTAERESHASPTNPVPVEQPKLPPLSRQSSFSSNPQPTEEKNGTLV